MQRHRCLYFGIADTILPHIRADDATKVSAFLAGDHSPSSRHAVASWLLAPVIHFEAAATLQLLLRCRDLLSVELAHALWAATRRTFIRGMAMILAHPQLLDANFSPTGIPSRSPPLVLAVGASCRRAVSLLLAHPTINVNAVDSRGRTALCHACCRSDASVVKQLLEAGADVNHRAVAAPCPTFVSSLDTPLLCASIAGHVAIVRLLLAHPEIDVRRGAGRMCRTACEMALRHGQTETLRCLLRDSRTRQKYELLELAMCELQCPPMASVVLGHAGEALSPAQALRLLQLAIKLRWRPLLLQMLAAEATQTAARENQQALLLAACASRARTGARSGARRPFGWQGPETPETPGASGAETSSAVRMLKLLLAVLPAPFQGDGCLFCACFVSHSRARQPRDLQARLQTLVEDPRSHAAITRCLPCAKQQVRISCASRPILVPEASRVIMKRAAQRHQCWRARHRLLEMRL